MSRKLLQMEHGTVHQHIDDLICNNLQRAASNERDNNKKYCMQNQSHVVCVWWVYALCIRLLVVCPERRVNESKNTRSKPMNSSGWFECNKQYVKYFVHFYSEYFVYDKKAKQKKCRKRKNLNCAVERWSERELAAKLQVEQKRGKISNFNGFATKQITSNLFVK